MEDRSNFMPEWFRKSAVYQINPRTFSREGTLETIKNELPKLNELGFRIVYLCPVFEEDESEDKTNWSMRQLSSETENPKNPYRMNDYFKIDSEYGSMNDLEALIESAHLLGMRVILDLVYLHIGPNAPIIKKHPEFVKHNEDGSIKYTDWRFPYLNFENTGLCEYLWCNMVYYIAELDADGFRCDVGDGIPEAFWLEGRRRILAVKPDAIMINEGSKYERIGVSFDCCYNFGWHEDIYKCICGKITALELVDNEKNRLLKVPEDGYLLRDMDNHDTVTDWPARVENVAGHDGMEAILALNYCMAGIPMVYSGNELADSTYQSMFANRFHMGKFEVTNRAVLVETEYGKRRQYVIRKLNALRSENDAVNGADMEWLDNDYPEKVISFVRRGANGSFIFVCNLSHDDIKLNIKQAISDTAVIQNNCIISGNTVSLGIFGYALMGII